MANYVPDEKDERGRQKNAISSLLLLTNWRALKTSRKKEFVNLGVKETYDNERQNVLNETGKNCEPKKKKKIISS